MKTSYDEEYKAAILAIRLAHSTIYAIERKMERERDCWEGGAINQRKYQPLRKHMERLANDAIGYKGPSQ